MKKPKLGQNFLVDDAARHAIANALGAVGDRTVIEIGPGHGAITSVLADRCRSLIAIEVDRALAAELRFRFRAQPHVEIVEADVLAVDLAALTPPGETADVLGNLPYYITSQILFKLAASHASIDRAVLMVQREVADRVTSDPGSRDYGLLSVTVQMYGPTQNLFTLPPSAFTPPPDVHSTVFRWRFAPRFVELDLEEVSFTRFLRTVFAQKRKTLANNLRAASIPAPAITAALERAQISPQARAEALSVEALASLWHGLNAEKAASFDETASPLFLDPNSDSH